MITKKKNVTNPQPTAKMRISQGHVAKVAIHDIEMLFQKMSLNPKTPKHDKRRLVGSASVPTQLIEEVAAASDQHGTLIGMPFDSDGAREALAFAAAFEPVATKAEAFAERVRDAILLAKADAGGAALAVYAAMKGIVRREEGAPLRDSFDKMTKIMKQRRKGRGSRAAQPVEPAAPPGARYSRARCGEAEHRDDHRGHAPGPWRVKRDGTLPTSTGAASRPPDGGQSCRVIRPRRFKPRKARFASRSSATNSRTPSPC